MTYIVWVSGCEGPRYYVTIDALDPNIAAIRGLAAGPFGSASPRPGLDVFAASHMPPSTTVSCVIRENWYGLKWRAARMMSWQTIALQNTGTSVALWLGLRHHSGHLHYSGLHYIFFFQPIPFDLRKNSPSCWFFGMYKSCVLMPSKLLERCNSASWRLLRCPWANQGN